LDIANIQSMLPGLIDALSDAVVVVDRDFQITAANRRYRELFGASRPDVKDTGCAGGQHRAGSGAGVTRCPACEVLESRTAQRLQRQIPDASGVMRRYDASFSPILGTDQAVTHVVEVWRDVTDRSRLEVQLSHSERLASIGTLAAGVAHEINNPLASMLACVESLDRWLRRGHFDEDARCEASETIAMLGREIVRCGETTEKLMLLGRSYDAAPGWVDMNQAVRDTLVLLRFEMRKREVEAVEVLDPDLPAVWAREAGMRGMCMNLMLNAVQAMTDGGKLTVTTSRDPRYIHLAIEDTGPGIAALNLERIWEPFFTTKPVGQGTGLGLSITHRIVSRHGGTISVDSGPGRGARFDISLPIQGTGGDL
jgi:PAS domain S-box-containing protein